MHERLKGITPMISVNKFEEDFQRHKKIGDHLRRPIFGASSPHTHKTRKSGGDASLGALSNSMDSLPAIGNKNPLDEIRDEVIGKKKRADMAERQLSLSKINATHKIQNHTISFTHEPEPSPGNRLRSTQQTLFANLVRFCLLQLKGTHHSDPRQKKHIGEHAARWRQSSMSEWHRQHILRSFHKTTSFSEHQSSFSCVFPSVILQCSNMYSLQMYKHSSEQNTTSTKQRQRAQFLPS